MDAAFEGFEFEFRGYNGSHKQRATEGHGGVVFSEAGLPLDFDAELESQPQTVFKVERPVGESVGTELPASKTAPQSETKLEADTETGTGVDTQKRDEGKTQRETGEKRGHSGRNQEGQAKPEPQKGVGEEGVKEREER
jgi:hypothetical protein